MSRNLIAGLLFAATVSLRLFAAVDEVRTGPVVQGNVFSVSADTQGNRYLSGYFQTTTIDFNMAPGIDAKTTATLAGYVTRLNADGSYAWTQVFDGNGTVANDTVPSADGTILYVLGSAGSSLTVGGTPAGAFFPSTTNAFVAALSAADGSLITTFGVGGVVSLGAAGFSAANGSEMVLSGSTIYFCGELNGSNAGFNGVSGTINAAGTSGPYNFVAAISSADGSVLTSFNSTGVQTFGGPNSSAIGTSHLAASATRIYLAGAYQGIAAGIGGINGLDSQSGSEDGYVACLDAATGAADFGFAGNGFVRFSGTQFERIYSVAVSGTRVYCCGHFTSNDGTLPGHLFAYDTVNGQAFVFAVDAASGVVDTGFGTNGMQQFQNGIYAYSLAATTNALYVAGAASSIPGIGGAAGAGPAGAYVCALNLSSGTAIPTFGGDGIVMYTGSVGPNEFKDMTIVNNVIFAAGTSESFDGFFDTDGPYDASGVGGILVLIDPVTGRQRTFAGTPVAVTVLPNPAMTGTQISFSAAGTGAFAWDFGDGSPPITGNPVTHTYSVSVDTTFNVTLTGAGSQTIPVDIFVPNPGAQGVTNVGDGRAVPNPLAGIVTTQISSSGGVIELAVNEAVSSSRAITAFRTDFEDIPGRAATVAGNRAVHKFVQPRLYRARASALDENNNVVAIARKTIAVDARETGASDALPAPPSTAVVMSSLKGKFLFDKATPDHVQFKGSITLPPQFVPGKPDGNSLSIGIGNVVDSVMVDAKGKAILPSELGIIKQLKLKLPRLAKGTSMTVGGETVQITAKLLAPDLDNAGFDTEGISRTVRSDENPKGASRNIQLAVLIAGVAYEASAPVQFKLNTKADTGIISGRGAR